jgi:CheY-like chemotaxis protein
MVQKRSSRVNRPIEEDLRSRLVRSDEASRPTEGLWLCQPEGTAGRIDSKGETRVTKVLIVDDHPMVARYTKDEVIVLRPAATVLLAGTLTKAEEIVATVGSPDYVLLDLVLPDCQGLSGLVRLRALAPQSVIGVVSGETSPEAISQRALARMSSRMRSESSLITGSSTRLKHALRLSRKFRLGCLAAKSKCCARLQQESSINSWRTYCASPKAHLRPTCVSSTGS